MAMLAVPCVSALRSGTVTVRLTRQDHEVDRYFTRKMKMEDGISLECPVADNGEEKVATGS